MHDDNEAVMEHAHVRKSARHRDERVSAADVLRYSLRGQDPPGFEAKTLDDYIGRGVFTTRRFKKGDYLLEYRGKRCHGMPEKADDIYCLEITSGRKYLCIDAKEDDKSLGRLINDSTTPNIKQTLYHHEGEMRALFYALEDLEKGTEIRYNYGGGPYPWRANVISKKTLDAKERSIVTNTEMPKPDSTVYVSETDVSDSLSEIIPLQHTKLQLQWSQPNEERPQGSNDKFTQPIIIAGDDFDPNYSVNKLSEKSDDTADKMEDNLSHVELSKIKQKPGKSSFLQEKNSWAEEVGSSDDIRGLKLDKMKTVDEVEEVSSDVEQISEVQFADKTPEGKRKWNSKDYCLYCSKPFSKIFRHCVSHHRNEKFITEINALPLHGEERKTKIASLRNKGNFRHNQQVWNSGVGQIRPRKRPTKQETTKASTYLPCEYCQGSFKKDGLWKHQKMCSSKHNMKRIRRAQASAKMLVSYSGCSDDNSDALKIKVLSRMQADNITDFVRRDPDILAFGTKLLQSHPADHHALPISQRMRDVAKMLKEAKQLDKTITCIRDCIDPEKFDTLVKAVKVVAGYDKINQNYKKPSYARNIGYDINKIAAIIISSTLRAGDGQGDNTLLTRVQLFQTLKRNDWPSSISAAAQYTLDKRSINKPKLQPMASDIQKLTQYLKSNSELHKQRLRNDMTSTSTWNELSKMTLAHVSMFNRRRSGEIERLRLDQYRNKTIDMDNIPQEVYGSLGEVEKALVRKLHRVEIPGKRRRVVPVLMTETMVENIDLLNSTRDTVNVALNNPYVFARPYFESPWPVPANDCLRKYSKECGAAQPELIRSTRLRKHVATMSQILSLKENELDLLATYMGHDLRIHRDFYRLPESTLQVAKVSKILLMMEEGTISQYKGKSLDEIDVSLEESDENPDGSSDEADNRENEEESICAASNVNDSDELGSADVLVSSTSQSSHDQSHKESASSKNPHTKKRRYSDRMPWTAEEKNCMFEFFKDCLHTGTTPNMDMCIDAQNQYVILKKRKWSNLKDFVIAERRRRIKQTQKQVDVDLSS